MGSSHCFHLFLRVTCILSMVPAQHRNVDEHINLHTGTRNQFLSSGRRALGSISRFCGFIYFTVSLYLYQKIRSHHPEFKRQVTPISTNILAGATTICHTITTHLNLSAKVLFTGIIRNQSGIKNTWEVQCSREVCQQKS